MTASVLKMQRELVAVTEERDRLAAELQKLREQKPVAWVDYIEHGDGSVTHNYAKEPGATYARPLYADPVAAPAAHLQVCFGSMPESNGKTNWTAILHRGDITQGITIGRSEYKDRVRYEADKMRWIIGELKEKPDILQYDANLHSGYKAPAVPVIEGPAFTVAGDDELNTLLNLSADIARGEANQDSATLWNQTLESVLARLNAAPAAPAVHSHPDDAAVDRFAAAMKAKMAASRAKGRGGWEDKDYCKNESLQQMLIGHLSKGDPVDVGNFCMMLWNRGEPVAAPAVPESNRDRAARIVALWPTWKRNWRLTKHSPQAEAELVEAGGCAPAVIAAPAASGLNPQHVGSDFDDFLREDGNYFEVACEVANPPGMTVAVFDAKKVPAGTKVFPQHVAPAHKKCAGCNGHGMLGNGHPDCSDVVCHFCGGTGVDSPPAAQAPAPAVPAPSVPEEWRDMVAEILNWWDDQHMTLAQGRAIREKARALLQSAEVTK